ncbi:hypothetical protein Tco_0797760 [Tanacetum coccineum]
MESGIHYYQSDLIKNGNKVLKRTVRKVEHEYEPTTTEEKQDRRNEMKARATLIKKVQRTLLKQQYENFAALSSESMDQTFDRYELKAIEDGLPSEMETHALNLEGTRYLSCACDLCYSLKSTQILLKLAQEDLEQLHPKCLEEMDLQWEMAMLTIRARVKELDLTSQKNPTQNALIAQDRIGGYDWSYQAEEEKPTNYALMAFTSSGCSSSSDSKVDSCSKTCVKAYVTLKEQYDSLSSDYKKSQFNLVSYKVVLELVEARLDHYNKNEAVFEESINVLKLEVRLRDNA